MRASSTIFSSTTSKSSKPDLEGRGGGRCLAGGPGLLEGIGNLDQDRLREGPAYDFQTHRHAQGGLGGGGKA